MESPEVDPKKELKKFVDYSNSKSASSKRTERSKSSDKEDFLFRFFRLLAIFLLVLTAGIFVYHYYIEDDSSQQQQETVVQEENPDQPEEGVVGSGNINPISELWRDAPEPPLKEVVAAAEQGEIVTSEGKMISVPSMDIKDSLEECKVASSDDFCLVSSGVDSQGNSFDIYFFKDIVRSRTLENPSAFEKIEISGSPASGKIDLMKSNGESISSFVIALDDSTGFVFMAGESGESVDISSVLKGSTVK